MPTLTPPSPERPPPRPRPRPRASALRPHLHLPPRRPPRPRARVPTLPLRTPRARRRRPCRLASTFRLSDWLRARLLELGPVPRKLDCLAAASRTPHLGRPRSSAQTLDGLRQFATAARIAIRSAASSLWPPAQPFTRSLRALRRSLRNR
jgi:hypothetical protein